MKRPAYGFMDERCFELRLICAVQFSHHCKCRMNREEPQIGSNGGGRGSFTI